MMNYNYINIHDFSKYLRKLRRMPILHSLSKFLYSRKKKINKQWAPRESIPILWGHVPEVQARTNKLISGDENIGYTSYIESKYLCGQNGLKALSLGCGKGLTEIEFVKSNSFTVIDAYDLSEDAIAFAKKRAIEENVCEQINFRVADIDELELPKDYYDVFMTFHSLHHFSNLDFLYNKIKRTLKQDALIFINEYIGPTRWQWTDKQLDIVNGILNILPKNYREYFGTKSIKKKEYRPGTFSMYLNDPSEAIESEQIFPLLKDYFEIIEKKDYGGTILSLLFHEIAQNFIKRDQKTIELVQLCLNIEDLMLRNNEINSDFAVIVCRNRKELL